MKAISEKFFTGLQRALTEDDLEQFLDLIGSLSRRQCMRLRKLIRMAIRETRAERGQLQ